MRRGKLVTTVSAALMVPLAVAGGVVWALRTDGSAEDTAARYLAAWSKSDYRWRVSFSPSAIHRDLTAGARFKVTQVPAESAPILAADGTRIDTPTAPGSVLQIVDGLMEQYGARLKGRPSARVEIVKEGRAVTTVATGKTVPGTSLRTTIDLKVHEAGAAALEGVAKPASLVALRPSTGEVLAAVNRPGGFNRALLGTYPPGSTFKVVTASALVAGGMAPGAGAIGAVSAGFGRRPGPGCGRPRRRTGRRP
ncbi:penicillin-binding transpeptidase domain-containing protein [Sphaerisporangium perillae]|uniref:penicillin-binding transpeptidase domain-containing protein n=1 Tax=Sphaerisporangium perillae TaxID=2935860 RepID=UPI00200C7FBA|nr:penicillin-binding transpeptidase domain-containing protein [Sphaerisporangium perillae]